jgi:hypothetical protein
MAPAPERASPNPPHPVWTARRSLRLLLISGLLALCCAATLLAPAEAASRRLVVTDGRTVSTKAVGTIATGTVRAAFRVPRKRAATLTIGLDLRRQRDGDRYRVRARVTGSGTLRVAVLRYRGPESTVLGTRRLSTRVQPGQTLWVEGAVSGSRPVTVRVRAWVKGKATPGWQRSVRDTSRSRVAARGTANLVVGLASAAGRKKVSVTYGSVRVAASAATVSRRKPSASTTGVPAGTKLRVHRGNIVVTKAGTRLDRLDIRGFVVVKAPNVTISRSIVRGGKPPKTAQGVITNYGSKNLVIVDTDIRTTLPSVYLDGIKGWNFTARRVHVTGNVDSIKIHGDNVTVADSLLEHTTWYAHDRYQGGGPTHNDNIQILKGRNLLIAGNTIRGAQNFAVLGAANLGDVPDLVVRGNWLDGGHCTLKLQTMRGHKLRATVTDNRFGPNRRVSYCPIQSLAGVTLTARNNVSEQTGRPVQIWRRP